MGMLFTTWHTGHGAFENYQEENKIKIWNKRKKRKKKEAFLMHEKAGSYSDMVADIDLRSLEFCLRMGWLRVFGFEWKQVCWTLWCWNVCFSRRDNKAWVGEWCVVGKMGSLLFFPGRLRLYLSIIAYYNCSSGSSLSKFLKAAYWKSSIVEWTEGCFYLLAAVS